MHEWIYTFAMFFAFDNWCAFAPIHNLSGTCPHQFPHGVHDAPSSEGINGGLHQVIRIVRNYPFPSTRDFQAFGSQKVTGYFLNICIIPVVMVNAVHPKLTKFFCNISLGWDDLLHHLGVEKGGSFGKGSSVCPQWLWQVYLLILYWPLHWPINGIWHRS